MRSLLASILDRIGSKEHEMGVVGQKIEEILEIDVCS